MLMVGPRRTCAPLALASSPSNRPSFSSSSVSHVAPRPVAQGRQAAGTPLKNRVPRTPFGPSEVRRAGMFKRGTEAVCQKSTPTNKYMHQWLYLQDQVMVNGAHSGHGLSAKGNLPAVRATFSASVSSERALSTSIWTIAFCFG